MEVIARASFVRCSPRKLRLVADGIRRLSLQEAIILLENSEKAASRPLLKVVKQAIANATNNLGMDKATLKIKEIQISQGPVYKRWRAVSRGRAHKIAKKTSHIKMVLAGEEPKKPRVKKGKEKGGKNGTKS